MIGTPETDGSESIMNAYSMVGSASYSMVAECNRLYDNEVRINDVKSYSKYKSREEKNKVKKSLPLVT